MDVMLSSSSNSLPAQVYDLNAFLLFRSVQFNPTLAQQSKYWQSSNLTSYGVPAFLCLCKSLNEGAKSLRAKLFSWQCLLLSLTWNSRDTLSLQLSSQAAGATFSKYVMRI